MRRVIPGKTIGKFKEDNAYVELGATESAVRDANPMFFKTFLPPFSDNSGGEVNLISFRILNMAGSVLGLCIFLLYLNDC